MLENLSKMADEAQTLIRELYPSSAHGGAKVAQWKAYRDLKLRSARRARAIWHGEARRIDAEGIDALRTAKARRQAAELATQFHATIAHLRAVDEDFYGPTIAELQRAIDEAGI